MKKVLSLLLGLLMLLSSLVFPTAAETASTASSTALTIIPVSDMDETSGWSGSAVLDTIDPYQGNASLATSFTTVDEAGDIKFQYDLATKPYDTTGMAYVYFDLYLSDADVFVGHDFELELRSPNGNDSHERRIQMPLADFIIGTPKDGWNRARVTIADMTAVGLVSASSWCYLRFFNSDNGTVGTEGVRSTIKMDNVFFASAEVESAAATDSSVTVTSASLSLDNSFKLTFVASFVGARAPVMQTERGMLVQGTPTAVSGHYSFEHTTIFAHRLADMIKPTFWYLDNAGKLAKSVYEGDYSVKQYCQNILTKIGSDDASLSGYTTEQKAALSRLLSDVLYYGAAAQTYASYNTGDGSLATSGVANLLSEQPYVTPEDYVRMPLRGVKTGGTATWRSASLVLDSAINVRFSFTSTRISDVTVDVILDDHTAYELKSFSKMIAADGTTVYYFDVPVFADDYDREITVVFDNYHESRISYSVNTYIANNYKNNSSKLSALLCAINNYGASAKAYVAAMQNESEDPMSTYYVFTDADKALFEGSYKAFADRIMENGYAPTSVTGAYSGEFMRDAACQIRAHMASGDYGLVKRMFEYIYSYHKADGVPYFRHIIDLVQTAATFDIVAERSGTVDESKYKQPSYATALFGIIPGTNACAQKFSVPVDAISGISVYLKNIPADGRIILELSDTAPARGSTTIGFASPIASVTMNCADIATKNGWTAFAFDDDVSITPNTEYYFNLRLEESTTKATAYGLISAPGTAFNFDQNWKGIHNEATLAYEIHFGGADILTASQTTKTNQVSWIKHTSHAAAQRFVATTDTLSAVSVLVDSPAGINADGSARAGAMTLYVTKTDPTSGSTLDLSGALASATLTIDKINPNTVRTRDLWTRFSFGIPLALTKGETYYFVVTSSEALEPDETNVLQLYGNVNANSDCGSYTFDKKWSLKTFHLCYKLYESMPTSLIFEDANMPTMGIHSIRQPADGATNAGGGGSMFVAESNYVSSIEVYLKGAESNVGSVTLWVGDTAPNGATHTSPFASPLASVTLDLSDIQTGWVKFDLDEAIKTTPEKSYYFVLSATSDVTSNLLTVGATGQGDNGRAYTFNGGWKAHKGITIAHRIYGQAPAQYSSYLTVGGNTIAAQMVDASMNGRYVTCADVQLSRAVDAAEVDTYTIALYKGDVLVDEITRALSSLDTEQTVIHFNFRLPLEDTVASDAYTIRLSASKANSVRWYGVPGADAEHAATLDGATQDLLLSHVVGSIASVRVVDEKIQVDGHYQMMDAYAMFALECYDEYPDFIELTYPMMKAYADYFFDPANTYERKVFSADKVYTIEGEYPYYDESLYGLILNPCLEHSREGSYWEGYDLITNVFAAESTNKMSQLATLLGKTADATELKTRADKLSAAINKYMVASFEGKPIYIEMIANSSIKPGDVSYVARDWELFYGFSFVNMSPVAANWYAMDEEIIANTYEAYLGRAAELYKTAPDGSQHVIRPSVCTLDEDNRTVKLHSHIVGKDLSWELYHLYKTGNTERLAHLMDYLAKVSLNGAYAETYNRNGGQADVGNQEQTGWLLYEIARIVGICKN